MSSLTVQTSQMIRSHLKKINSQFITHSSGFSSFSTKPTVAISKIYSVHSASFTPFHLAPRCHWESLFKISDLVSTRVHPISSICLIPIFTHLVILIMMQHDRLQSLQMRINAQGSGWIMLEIDKIVFPLWECSPPHHHHMAWPANVSRFVWGSAVRHPA